MTGGLNGAVTELVVVQVTDAIDTILTGREDLEYQSPPLPRDDAMTLVQLLLGRGGAPREGETSWRCAIAGGRRTITLEPLGWSETASPASRAFL